MTKGSRSPFCHPSFALGSPIVLVAWTGSICHLQKETVHRVVLVFRHERVLSQEAELGVMYFDPTEQILL